MTGRATAAVVLIAALSVGALGGIVLDRLLLVPNRVGFRARPRGFGRGPGGFGGPGARDPRWSSDRLARALDLSAAQHARVDSILSRETAALRSARAKIQPETDTIVAKTRSALDSVFTPAQREQFHAMRDRNGFGLPFPSVGGGGGRGRDSGGPRPRD